MEGKLLGSTDQERARAETGHRASSGESPGSRWPAIGERVSVIEIADDLTDLKRAEDELHHTSEMMLKIARGVSGAGGDRPLDALLDSLVDLLEADGGVAACLDPTRAGWVDTLSMSLDGRTFSARSYALAGTPCEKAVADGYFLCESGVARSFPADTFLFERGIEGYAGIALRDRDDQVLGLLAVFYRRQVTQPELVRSALQIFAARVAAEIERQSSDTRIREQAALLDQARDAIFVRDLDFRILYWNQGAERLYGWTSAEAIGRRVDDLIAADLTTFHAANSILMERGERNSELVHRTKDGRIVVVDGRATVLRDAAGRPRSVLAILTDITERKQYEGQALRAQRLDSVGTLAAGIAHDLNNALAPILMSTDLLRERARDSADLELIETIDSSARRGADMVRRMLSFARGVEGESRPVDVAQLVEAAAKISRETFPKNIVVVTEVGAGLWHTFGDATQLHQVLVNLCINARDAMPAGGALTINAHNESGDESGKASPGLEPGPHVAITVADDGSGIPPALLEKVFDPFFTTKEVGKGTGLGLSTSLAILRGHRGTIALESEEGRGTRFRIRLPAHVGPAPTPIAVQPPESQFPGVGSVLVIDDEAPIRGVVRRALESRGYRVLLAADGAEGVAQYRAHRDQIAVVIVDMMMPVMDGPAAMRELLAFAPEVRIVAASGVSDEASASKALSLGACEFLAKPFRIAELIRAVDAARNGSR